MRIGLTWVKLDLRVLAFSAALGIGTTLLCGATSAWRASRADLNEALKGARRSVSTAGLQASTTRWLVVLEVSLSLMLLVGAA